MNVLLVEDSEEVREITIEYLLELGHAVHAVGDAEQALAKLLDAKFDVVMTDLSLPGMSGIDLARRLNDAYPQLAVVVCSGHSADKVKLMLGGLDRVLVLSKPYDWQELKEVLAAAPARRSP
jgi:CheY-like chemotaxis protein